MVDQHARNLTNKSCSGQHIILLRKFNSNFIFPSTYDQVVMINLKEIVRDIIYILEGSYSRISLESRYIFINQFVPYLNYDVTIYFCFGLLQL